MKRQTDFLLATLFFSILLLWTGCKKADPPKVTTGAVSDVALTTAKAVGTVVNDGGADVTARGVVWSTQTAPTTSGNMTSDGTGVGEFTSQLNGLTEGTTYYLRAYATNSEGTSYGDEVTFATAARSTATITTTAVTGITLNSAVSGGNISSDGMSEVTARGVCWGTTTNPTINGSKTSNGTGTGAFTSSLTNLAEATTYYVRAYATNSKGTAYGNEITFTTIGTSLATITTADATGVTFSSAVTGGNVTSDGLSAVTARGVCWGTSANPTIAGNKTTNGTGTGAFTSNLTNLTDGTTYYVRAYATNGKGTAYGNQVTFSTTAATTATLTTTALSGLTLTAVTTGGNITGDGGSAVTARGVVYGISDNPTITGTKTTNGSGTGTFVSNITGLTAGSVYHVRAYATNSKGTVYGNEIIFVTPIADGEGNVYKTVLIGTQVWMAENLKSTQYNNNTPIPQVTDSLQWMTLTTPAYCWYRNRESNKPIGALYTWYTVATGNLCPTGWHVPTNAEYQIMEVAVGVPADSVNNWGWRGNGAGTKLKDATAWGAGNGNNISGWTAMPSGYRAWANSEFRGLNILSYYWTATDDAANANPTVAWYRRLDATSPWIYKATTGKAGGKSVRCIKNQ